MLKHGRVVSFDTEASALRLVVASDGKLSDVRLPLSTEAPTLGSFVRVMTAPSGVCSVEVLGPESSITAEDATRWWRPYATRPTRMQRLVQRAALVRSVRNTLDTAGFLEVQVPLLLRASCPDVHIESHRVGDRYLTPSTEYQLKRMFVGGFERLYSLTQNFREGDVGKHHNPEFTMLEWARAYESLPAIEKDAEVVIRQAFGVLAPDATSVEFNGHRVEISGAPWERISVRQALHQHLGMELDERFSLGSMRSESERLKLDIPKSYCDDPVDIMTLLLDRIQPLLGTKVPTFLVEWPAFLTTSAPPLSNRPEVAERSELFIAGVEIADGFPFLRDAELQEQLFQRANAARIAQHKRPVDLDERYLNGLREGIPPGAGMALGIDRLVMVLTGENDIRNVLPFGWDEL